MAPRRPFFSLLHDLLDKTEVVRLEDLLAAAGTQTYGLLILFLALPSLVPGINAGLAPAGGFALVAAGIQMARGVPHPWVPRRLRQVTLHKGRVKGALAKVEGFLDRFAADTGPGLPLNRVWTGAAVAWTGFLLGLPVPLPFGNILPAAILCLFGAAVLEQRPAWAWAAALASAGNTAYFIMSFRLVYRGVHALWS